MTIRGSDLPPGVLAERFLDGYHQRLVDHVMYGTRWECDCPGDQAVESEGVLSAQSGSGPAR